jgi:Protein of unknown function (DUF3047)
VRPRLSRSTRALLLISGVVVVVVALVLLATPGSRARYLGGAVPATSLDARELMRRVAGRSTPAVIATRRQVLVPDAEGLRVPMSDDPPPRIPIEGVPSGWQLREFSGRADMELVRGERGLAFHLRSARASYALYRDVVVSLDEFSSLAWSWKVAQLPTGGDVRDRVRDDQAAQVYVVFPRWPSPRTRSDVIGYVWDTTAPVGTTVTSPRAGNVKIIVVESGAARRGTWQRQRRNVAADYQRLFQRPPPRVGAIAVMIDADDTASSAEATIGDLIFVRESVAERGKTPTPMLR